MGSFIAASEYLVDVTGTTESASPLVNKPHSNQLETRVYKTPFLNMKYQAEFLNSTCRAQTTNFGVEQEST